MQTEAKAEDPAEELEEDAADDDVDYRNFVCEFQWSLRTELLSETQPNAEQDASHWKICMSFNVASIPNLSMTMKMENLKMNRLNK